MLGRVPIRRVAVVTGAVAALVASVIGVAGPAAADPASPLRARDVAGVGSDTTQYVIDAVASAYNAQAGVTVKLGSWDAVPPAGGSTTITTKKGCAPIARPNGGSAGIAALLADTTGCIDFARTVSPKATDGSQASLTFYAYARDGVAWGTIPATPAVTPQTLTTAQLASIYTCQTTNWHTVLASLPSNAIHPKLPQPGSALRKTFLTRIGLTDATVGSCVDQTLQQNQGDGLNGDTLAVFPHSVASWIAQANGVVTDNRGGFVLRAVNGKRPLTATGKLSNTYDPNFLYLAYNVVKTASASKYTKFFARTGFICKNPSILTTYGFQALGSACGTTS